ncbi:MAG: PspC domain-containing protein [Marmoricola sp.]
MDQTQNPTSDAPGAAPPPEVRPPAEGPRVSAEQMRDLRLLRRSRADRRVAGVAGGLGRHLDIDPTVLRVAFAVLCFFGGAGFLLYGALWLLVPEDGTDRAHLATSEGLQRILLIGAGVLAVVFVLGQGWSGWWFGSSFPLTLVGVAVVAWLVLRERRRRDPVTSPRDDPTAGAGYASAAGPQTGPMTPGPGYPPPPGRSAWAPPRYVPPAPRRPRRTGPLLVWPTLALVAVALGALGIYDNAGHLVNQSAYPALALAVTGAMLVVGAFVGRPGGLTLIGVVATAALAFSSITGGFHEARHASYAPGSSSGVRPSYDMLTGELVLNLSDVADLDSLDGRTIDIDGDAGLVEVVVPPDLRLDVAADIDFAGGIHIDNQSQGGGFGPQARQVLNDQSDLPTVRLNVHIRVGQIEVRNSYE